MVPLLATIALVALSEGDSVGYIPPEAIQRPIHMARTRIGLFGGSLVSIEGDSVASVVVSLKPQKPTSPDAYAEYMSVGPIGAAVPATDKWQLNGGYRRLRVTIRSCETMVSLIIDDVFTGRADRRAIRAEYLIQPGAAPVTDLWTALRGARRVLGPEPSGPPIVWLGPTSFAWITRADTLVVKQKADSIFQMTLRARVRF